MITFNRIGKNVASNVFNNIVTLVVQIASLPIYLKFWPLDVYGRWLYLSAVPYYFTICDGGFIAVGANRMTMESSSGNKATALAIYATLLNMLLVIFSMVGVVVLLLGFLSYLEWLVLGEDFWIVILLVLNVFLVFFTDLFESVYRCNDKYPKGMFAVGLVRLFEWITSLAFLISFKSLLMVAVGLLVGRFIGNVIFYGAMVSEFGSYSALRNFFNFDKMIFKELISPSLHFLVFPISNAISIQGYTFLVGYLYGPVSLAIFNSYRVISRSINQITQTMAKSAMPIFSTLFSRDDIHGLDVLQTKIMKLLFILALSVCGIVVLFLKEILAFWSHGKMPLDYSLINLLFAATVVNAIYQVKQTALKSVNLHPALTRINIWSLFLGIACSAFFYEYGLWVVPCGMILTELMMWYATASKYDTELLRYKQK